MDKFASQINVMLGELKKQHELLAASDARIHEIDPLAIQPEPPKKPAPPQNLRIVE